MRPLRITLFITVALFTSYLAHAQVVIQQITAGGIVELKNESDSTINVSDYWLCARPRYERLASMDVECGELNLTPGATVVVISRALAINAADGELGLYIAERFADTSSIIDFVIWGDPTGLSREIVAAGAGIWKLGERAPSFSSAMSLNYKGTQGDSGSGYFLAEPNICAVDICDVSGGAIAFDDESTSAAVCVDDGEDDMIAILTTGTRGDSLRWLVTDADGKILMISNTNVFNFEGAPAGVVFIWALAYSGEISGLVMDSLATNLMGCLALSNPIEITRQVGADCAGVEPVCDVDGGNIISPEGDTITVIIGGETPNLVELSIDSTVRGESQAWVITDADLTIIALPIGPPFNFEDLGEGVRLIWHVSFDGALSGVAIGEKASDISGCFSLSNAIVVNVEKGEEPVEPVCDVDGGNIISPEGDTITVIIGGETPNLVELSIDSTVRGESQAWVITDADLTIIALPIGPPFNFEDLGEGVRLIWHVSFDGALSGVATGANAGEIEGCFDLSSAVVVNVEKFEEPEESCEAIGGTISTAQGDKFTICTGDGKSDAFDVALEGNVGMNSAWVLTDVNGRIIALPASPPFDFESSGDGIVRIWHLSFEDGLTGASLSANVADLKGCFALSNPIEVDRQQVRGGTISGPAGIGSLSLCSGTGNFDAFDLSIVNSRGMNTRWVVTDLDGKFLEVDAKLPFELQNIEVEEFLIWHLSFNGDLVGLEVGAAASGLEGCFALSNSFAVSRMIVSGGQIATLNGETETTICADADPAELVNAVLTGASGSNSAWVVTDELGVINEILNSSSFNLSTGSGTAFIWHLSFEDGMIGAQVGANARNLQGCFSLSNPIRVNILRGSDCPVVEPCELEGGILTTIDGDTEITICSDGNPDPFNVVLQGATGSLRAWVVTDEEGFVLGLPLAPPFDLDALGAGVAQVWSLSYELGAIIPTIGGNVAMFEGCFALSTPITVTRVVDEDCPVEEKCEVFAGTIRLEDGTTEITICTDDGIADPINAIVNGSDAPQTAWVITDERGTIQAILDGLPFNFEGTGSGTSFLWHVGFDDSFVVPQVGQSASVLEGCVDLSNPLTINKRIADECERCNVDGGTVLVPGGNQDIAFCPEDAVFVVGHVNKVPGPYFYIVTDGNGLILSWQLSGNRFIDLRGSTSGRYRVYGSSIAPGRSPKVGDPVTSVTIGCGQLSRNFISVTIQEGDECDKGCHAPRNVRIRKIVDNRFNVQWQRVKEADSYVVRLRYSNNPDFVVEVPVQGRKVTVLARPDQDVEISVAAVCRGVRSPFSPVQVIDTKTKSNRTKNLAQPRDLFEVSEFEVIEQAIIYPNPTSTLLNVYYDGGSAEGFLEIFDASGRRVKTEKVAPHVETFMIDVSALEEGMYILTITSEGDMVIRERFIKTR